MKKNHKYYLDLAFEIAKENLGKTKLNPSVGVAIVKNNSIISTGVTSPSGRPHAEFNALNKKGDFSGANLYTTLEPCTHYGLTPPCVNIIVKKKIKNVYYGFEDPDARTFRKAKIFLKKKNIKAQLIQSRKFANFYSSYFVNKKNNMPYLTGKIAISRDLYSINKRSKWITNNRSIKITHLLRSRNDCIFSTSKSINTDNSLLNCRIEGLNNYKPDLFILDMNLKLKKGLLLNKMINKRNTFLITNAANIKKTLLYRKKGYKIIFIDVLKNKDDFILLFKKIYKLGYGRVFFETGLTFLNSLLNHKLLNNLYVFQSNKKLKSNGFNNSTLKYLNKIVLKNKIKVNLDNNNLYRIDF